MTDPRKQIPRRAKRKACALEAHFSTHSFRFPGRVTDISLFGAFVDTLNPLPAQSPIELALTLSSGTAVKTEGRVIWSQENMGMGVEFTELPDESRNHIDRLLTGLS